jgi:hypothetical protein
MQIKTHSLAFLPVPLDQAQTRAQSQIVPVTATGQGTQITRATRTVEDIKQAEMLLNRQRTRNGSGPIADESRQQQRALAAYQALQRDDERSYVSQVLGIDVFA